MWVSAIDASDRLHSDGEAVLERLIAGHLPMAVTTDLVLDETLTILKRRGARIPAIQHIANDILSSPLLRVVYVDEPLFRQSILDFGKYEQFSFTDAVSLTLMTRYKIREIYSHDQDFDLKGIVRKERP